MVITLAEAKASLEVRVEYDLQGAELRLVPYSRSAVQYRPERLTLTFRASSDKPGLVTDVNYAKLTLSRAIITGRKLKKDGSPSAVAAREEFWRTSADLPEWVSKVAGQQLAIMTGRKITPEPHTMVTCHCGEHHTLSQVRELNGLEPLPV